MESIDKALELGYDPVKVIIDFYFCFHLYTSSEHY